MPKKIILSNMAAKQLVDLLSNNSWVTTPDDVYRAGKMLTAVLPIFVSEREYASRSGSTESRQQVIALPEAPATYVLRDDGSPDWSKMSPAEIAAYRADVHTHNIKFSTWARKPIDEIELTDKQVDTCKKAVKHFMPRENQDKDKPRQVLQINEFTFGLLDALGMGDE